MARLVVEESDDEFPDLKDIIKDAKPIAKAGARRSRDTTGIPDQEGTLKKGDGSQRKATTKSLPNTRESGLNKDDGGTKTSRESGLKKAVAKETAAAKPRKRVLNQKNDNPLLRPLSSALSSRESSEVPLPKREKSKDESLKELKSVTKTTTKQAPKALSRDARKEEPSRKTVVANEAKMSAPRERNKATQIFDSDEDENKATEKDARKPAPKSKSATTPIFDTDEDRDSGSDGMSNFIVDDSLISEEESVLKEVPPSSRSVRRLVQGRMLLNRVESDDENLGLQMERLTVKDKDDSLPCSKEISIEKQLEQLVDSFNDSPPRLFEQPGRGAKSDPVIQPKPKLAPATSGSDMDDPFILRFSPPTTRKPFKLPKETRLTTPPGSPSKLRGPFGLVSPSKKTSHITIPKTPHRPSMDSFWQADVINDWNDEYSPRKELFTKPKLQPPDSNFSHLLTSPKRIASPTKQESKAARETKKLFEESKHALASAFLAELDSKITNNQIGTLAATTGGVKIEWSNKLLTTAGRANWKRETIRAAATSISQTQRPPTKQLPAYRHHATIELATKVIDNPERLLNVLAHEFCHLANFMISGIKTNPHGKEFKVWASKVSRVFRDRGVEVTTKHGYEIEYKFIWKCVKEGCGREFGRHSRSLDTGRHVCGVCRGQLVQIKPVPRTGTNSSSVAAGEGEEKGKGLTEYQRFVKENMAIIKRENPGSPQKDIMGLVGKRYREVKAGKQLGLVGKGTEVVCVEDEDDDGSDGDDTKVEIDMDDEVEANVGVVARKLDFLHLTGVDD